ncbi:hypothetical protein [Pararhizobium sp. DWP1-1-3]|uniref:hypothetical protein n=1 Tax=Pararhizobium sp. DWP1-1-3 TaxID=2804652 RepID=UPI003CE6DFDC
MQIESWAILGTIRKMSEHPICAIADHDIRIFSITTAKAAPALRAESSFAPASADNPPFE